MLLLAAIGLGYSAFGVQGGMISTFAILFISILFVIIWIKYLPRSRMGKVFTLSKDAGAFKATDAHDELLDAEGVTSTPLRPSGVALINGKKNRCGC